MLKAKTITGISLAGQRDKEKVETSILCKYPASFEAQKYGESRFIHMEMVAFSLDSEEGCYFKIYFKVEGDSKGYHGENMEKGFDDETYTDDYNNLIAQLTPWLEKNNAVVDASCKPTCVNQYITGWLINKNITVDNLGELVVEIIGIFGVTDQTFRKSAQYEIQDLVCVGESQPGRSDTWIDRVDYLRGNYLKLAESVEATPSVPVTV